jgi:hypothetical protein
MAIFRGLDRPMSMANYKLRLLGTTLSLEYGPLTHQALKVSIFSQHILIEKTFYQDHPDNTFFTVFDQ